MKKIIPILVVFVLVISLVACTSNTTGAVAARLQNNTGKLLSTLNELDTLNTSDMLIDEIAPQPQNMSGYNGDYQGISKNYNVIGGTAQNAYRQNTNNMANNNATNYYQSNNLGNSISNTRGIYDRNTLTARQTNYMQDLNPNYGYRTPATYNTNTNSARMQSANQYGNSYSTNINNTRFNQNQNFAGQNNINQNFAGQNNINQNFAGQNDINASPSGAYTYVPMDEYKNQRNYMSRFNTSGYDPLERNSLDNYVGRVESIYNLTSQVFYANSLLTECKNELRLECEKAAVMADNLRTSNTRLTTDQREALNTHISEIAAATQKLGNTKGNLQKEINAIRPLRTSFNNNMESINARYTKILNSLVSRLNECQIALDSVKSCNNILTNKTSNNATGINQNEMRYSMNNGMYQDSTRLNNQNGMGINNQNGMGMNNNFANNNFTSTNQNTAYTPSPYNTNPNMTRVNRQYPYDTTNVNRTTPARPTPINMPNNNMLSGTNQNQTMNATGQNGQNMANQNNQNNLFITNPVNRMNTNNNVVNQDFITTTDQNGNSVTVRRENLVNMLNNSTDPNNNFITVTDINQNQVQIDRGNVEYLRTEQNNTANQNTGVANQTQTATNRQTTLDNNNNVMNEQTRFNA